MLIKKFPGTFFINNINVIIKLIKVTYTSGLLKCPNATKVVVLPITIPLFCNPINVIKTPIPTVIASFKEVGIDSMRVLENLVKAIMENTTPDTNTAANACCHESPIEPTIV